MQPAAKAYASNYKKFPIRRLYLILWFMAENLLLQKFTRVTSAWTSRSTTATGLPPPNSGPSSTMRASRATGIRPSSAPTRPIPADRSCSSRSVIRSASSRSSSPSSSSSSSRTWEKWASYDGSSHGRVCWWAHLLDKNRIDLSWVSSWENF